MKRRSRMLYFPRRRDPPSPLGSPMGCLLTLVGLLLFWVGVLALVLWLVPLH